MTPIEASPDRRGAVEQLLAESRGAAVVSVPAELGLALETPATGAFPSEPTARVVALDPAWSLEELERALVRFARWPSSARLFLGFVNEGSASRLVGLLTGGAVAPRCWADEQVRDRLAKAGLKVVSRKGFSLHAPTEFAAATREALHGLFRQLNASAADDWVLYEVAPGGLAPVREGLVEGRLSVVMRNHSTSRIKLLDHAVFSLATQSHRDLEIVLVTQSTEPDAAARLEEVLRRHQHLGQFRFQVIVEPSTEDHRARLVNLGIERASGQYLAVLDDDDVVYPHHYTRLIDALRAGTAAWAFAPVQRAYFTAGAGGALFCRQKNAMPHSESFILARLAYDNYVTCHSWVIDRLRVGRFQIRFEERLDKGEDYAMVLSMMALFHPVAVGGNASAEYRIRDNGSNTIIHETGDRERAAQVRAEWEAAIALKNELTDPLQMLMSKRTFVTESRRGLREGDAALGRELPELRYRLADRANELIKRALPFVHARLKAAASPGQVEPSGARKRRRRS